MVAKSTAAGFKLAIDGAEALIKFPSNVSDDAIPKFSEVVPGYRIGHMRHLRGIKKAAPEGGDGIDQAANFRR